ncbi:MAG: RDD family protein [Pyrinomonadaceae bacterium]
MQATRSLTDLESTEKENNHNELISTLVPTDFQPPFLLRLGSALIDYIVLLILPLTGLLSERMVGHTGFGVFTDRTIWLLAFLLAGANVVLLPLFRGQSVGKMLTGIRILRIDGTPAGFGALIVRQTLGYALTVATFGLGFLISALNGSGRTLHDFLTGTVTVRATRRTVSI